MIWRYESNVFASEEWKNYISGQCNLCARNCKWKSNAGPKADYKLSDSLDFIRGFTDTKTYEMIFLLTSHFHNELCQNICRMKMFRATSRQDLGFHVYTNSVFPSWNLPTHLKFLGRSARVCIFSLKSYSFLYNSFIVFSVLYLYFAFPRSHWFHYSLCGGSTKVCFSPVLPFDGDGRLL